MKSLFALFSAKKVEMSISTVQADVLSTNDLMKIRGGGEPVVQEQNIIIPD